MSRFLASLLTNYLRSECLGSRQNPAFWRRGTQRAVSRKRNQAARVKSLRDCPKQVHPFWKFAVNRPAIRGLQPHIGGCREVRFPRQIEIEMTPDRVAVRHLREECPKKKRRWFFLHIMNSEGTEVSSAHPDTDFVGARVATPVRFSDRIGPPDDEHLFDSEVLAVDLRELTSEDINRTGPAGNSWEGITTSPLRQREHPRIATAIGGCLPLRI
jgi:hypothetical protein